MEHFYRGVFPLLRDLASVPCLDEDGVEVFGNDHLGAIIGLD